MEERNKEELLNGDQEDVSIKCFFFPIDQFVTMNYGYGLTDLSSDIKRATSGKLSQKDVPSSHSSPMIPLYLEYLEYLGHLGHLPAGEETKKGPAPEKAKEVPAGKVRQPGDMWEGKNKFFCCARD